MKNVVLSGLVFGFMVLFTGCANKVHTYSPNTANIMHLKSMDINKVTVGTFTDSGRNERKVMCRLATPVGTASGKTFASYIQDAFIQELLLADKYDPNSKIVITANLDYIFGSTMLGNAYWEFKVTVKSSNGESCKVDSKYDYESSYLATSACSEMQRSFVPAVQKLISDIINNPNFKKLLSA